MLKNKKKSNETEEEKLKQATIAKALARLKLVQQSKLAESQAVDKSDRLLLYTLHQLTKAEELIPQTLASLNKAIQLAKEKNDEHSKIRIDYYEHQKKITQETFKQYADVSRKRLEYYQKLTEKKLWESEKELCKESTKHWFDYWAWTVDPRISQLGKGIPFILYPFQEQLLKDLEDLIFVKKSSALIEKSRDMGVTWLIMSLFFKHWLFQDGSFQVLVGSMTIDDVDTIGNVSSLFEKLRIQAILQPKPLLPLSWDREIPFLKCSNPETKASIIGESCNWRFGRSGRYTAIFLDEFSAVTSDSEVMASVSQSSPCRIYVSTPRGMHNEFAKLRFSGKIPVFTLHWTQHPLKNRAWYEFQKLELNDEARIAQELDIDYQASTPNRVYPEFDEIYHVITQTELMKALPEFEKNGEFYIPLGHSICMGEDVSMGEESAHVLLWFLTLREGSITRNGIDVSGTVLIYREIVMPPRSTPTITAEVIKSVESETESKSISMRYLSNEAITEREIYATEHNLYFKTWKTDYNSGITRVREYLRVIDKDKPHPFRIPPKGIQIKGRPRLFLVVADGQGELKQDKITGKLYVERPKDSLGMKRTREEFPLYHYPSQEMGKEVRLWRPKKIFDDAMDIIRCVADESFPPVMKLDERKERLKELQRYYTPEKLMNYEDERRVLICMNIEEELRNIKSEKQNLSFLEQIYQKALKNSS